MSHWVSLVDETGKPVAVPAFTDGGTYAIGGTTEADFNITYNYGQLIRGAMEGVGVRDLHGLRAGDVIALLERAVQKLGTTRDPDYWQATPGNAGAALARLLEWARLYPDAQFEVN